MTPSPTLSAVIASGAPRIEPKWTMVNEEWVQVMREIHRGPRSPGWEKPNRLNQLSISWTEADVLCSLVNAKGGDK